MSARNMARRDDLPWARWTWNRCPASTGGIGLEVARCDLEPGHPDDHVAERGVDADVCWHEQYGPNRVTSRGYPPPPPPPPVSVRDVDRTDPDYAWHLRNLPRRTAVGIVALAVCLGGAALALAGALGWGP